MYTVNQGPSKLVAKTRTGLSQNYEKIESIRHKNNRVNGAHTASGKSNISTSSNCSNNTQLSGTTGGDSVKMNNQEMNINVAKPVFQQYRRSNSNRSNSSYKNGIRIACFRDEEPQPIISPQYEELIRYIRDSWNVLSVECEAANEYQASTTTSPPSLAPQPPSAASSSPSSSMLPNGQPNSSFKRTKKVIVYHNDPPSPALQDFGPFDLESWWGRRLFNNITKSL